ncbi:uncharacterized protein DUF4307 [Murinocardiopsis flavida]|uniref:Uncharacterized protein DUF4307 n=1 Tax=Murinocardiopsis flavida TaxID=645275 RepID=A0A2P8CQX9_9ACTN|nr:DUF4307 domain-containing protein [Murinocardiopsis flavida]PSK87374.1 uncharacterized protein DUF4307 [Murinocardiopsis flavida]
MPSNTTESAPAAGDPAPATRRRHGNKPVIFIVGVVVAAVFTVGWGLALSSYNGSLNQTSYQTLSWTIDSGSQATVRFQVNGGAPSQCLITATDGRHVEVGQSTVDVEAGLRNATAKVETVRRASAVQVTSCREQESESD